MKVSGQAQRELRPHRVDELLSKFDIDLLGYPVVSFRDGSFWIIDGQHRIEALKAWLGDDWEKQALTCEIRSGLTEQQEAKLFLELNNKLTVNTFQKFKVAVTAKELEPTVVKRVVESVGLRISLDKENSVRAVSTLLQILKRSDVNNLRRTLTIVHESFGDPGLSASVINGVSKVCERYNTALNDKEAIARLSSVRGGVGSIVARANILRKQTGLSPADCIAAAMVDTLNAGKGSKKLPSWWKQ